MGPLVGMGGVLVPFGAIRQLEAGVNGLCDSYGFPPGEEFKWSPRKDLWMYRSLTGEARAGFFVEVLNLIKDAGARTVIVVEDSGYSTATDAPTAKEDVARLLLERVEKELVLARTEGIVIVDRPGGGRTEEDKLLADCLETLQSGTRYVKLERIALSLLCTSSKLVRLLQVADVVTSCTVALVAGESTYSPTVFGAIKPMLPEELGRTGGIGLKIHPDFKYANLYHWLLGDQYLVRGGTGHPLPLPDRPYSSGPHQP
jgi:hypothetical protein